MELINWWLNSVKFNEEELKLLQTENVIEQFVPNKCEQKDITKKLLSLLPISNGIENSLISFDTCATNIIDELFKKHVTDETLVITSGSEHPSVVNNLNKCKNVKVVVNSTGLESLNFDFTKYKNIFCYFIGLSVGDNHYMPNKIVESLQQLIKSLNMPSVFILDDVQEMFLLPRDYSIYDYVIGTAHALIPKFNTGILIDPKGNIKSERHIERGYTYYELLKILFKKKELLQQFGFILNEYFRPYILTDKNLSMTFNGPYTYNLIDYKKRLYDLNEIDALTTPQDYSPATFRACPAAIFQEQFLKKINNVTTRLTF